MSSRPFAAIALFVLGACLSAHADVVPDTLELPLSESKGASSAQPDNEGVYRLEGAALRRFATLEEALDALPGFRVRRQGGLGGYSELSFRGARASQVDIYVDGIRLNQDGDAAPDLAKWPLLWFSSLEARSGLDPRGAGPGSLARIDLSTRSESRGEVQARAGSFYTGEAAVSARAGELFGWKFGVGAEGQTARNDYPFFSDNGTAYNTADDGTWRMENNAYWSRGARVAARREEAASRQSVSLIWLDSRKEYPGLFPSTARAYARRTDWLGAWRLENFEGSLPWEAGIQARRFEDSYRDPGQSLGYLSYESARASVSGEGDARVRARIGPRMDARVDARLRAEETKPLVTPFSARYSSPDATRGEAQGGLGLEARLPAQLVATVEARQSCIRFRADGLQSLSDTTPGRIASQDLHPFALRAGIRRADARAAWDQSLGFNARREQRAPTSGELLGDNLGVVANLDLKPEEARSFSATYALSARNALKPSLQSTVFWNSYLDPVRLKARGASAFMRYENDADYRSTGFEALASLSARLVETMLSLTLQDATILGGLYKGNRPAYQSPLEAHAELFVKPGVAATLQTRVGLLADFRGAHYPDASNIPVSRRDAEWELGAHTDLQIGNGGPLRLAADARNLTDRHYRDFAYSPRSGRSYSLSLSFTL